MNIIMTYKSGLNIGKSYDSIDDNFHFTFSYATVLVEKKLPNLRRN
jgi:hypothetical protein